MVSISPNFGVNPAQNCTSDSQQVRAMKPVEAPETGVVKAKKLEDGYTIQKFEDGSYKIFTPDGQELSQLEMLEYMKKLVEKSNLENQQTPVTSDAEVETSEVSQNKCDGTNVGEYSSNLSDISSQYIQLIKDKSEYTQGEFLGKRNELIKNSQNQQIFNSCLGDPNTPALTKNGVIKLKDGTTFFMTRRQDIHTREYYWDVSRLIPAKND